MEVWQIELLKIGATALVSFFVGLGSYWFYLRRRKKEREEYLMRREIEGVPDRERLQEAEKLTSLYIRHQKHRISPEQLYTFKERILSRAYQDEKGFRNMREILEAEEEFFDKVWYGRHKLLETMVESGRRKVDPEIWQEALYAAGRIEEKYGKEQLASWDDFEWGMLSGKLSALRWVSGDEWDMLDT